MMIFQARYKLSPNDNFAWFQKNNTRFSNLFVFYLFVFFLFIIQLTKAKKASNTSLLYSFSVYFLFFHLLYSNKKKTCYLYCVKLNETCYNTCTCSFVDQ